MIGGVIILTSRVSKKKPPQPIMDLLAEWMPDIYTDSTAQKGADHEQ